MRITFFRRAILPINDGRECAKLGSLSLGSVDPIQVESVTDHHQIPPKTPTQSQPTYQFRLVSQARICDARLPPVTLSLGAIGDTYAVSQGPNSLHGTSSIFLKGTYSPFQRKSLRSQHEPQRGSDSDKNRESAVQLLYNPPTPINSF